MRLGATFVFWNFNFVGHDLFLMKSYLPSQMLKVSESYRYLFIFLYMCQLLKLTMNCSPQMLLCEMWVWVLPLCEKPRNTLLNTLHIKVICSINWDVIGNSWSNRINIMQTIELLYHPWIRSFLQYYFQFYYPLIIFTRKSWSILNFFLNSHRLTIFEEIYK